MRKVEDIRLLLNAGADKVSINSAAVFNPEFVQEASQRFGAQCIVVAIDAKKTGENKWEIFTHGGLFHFGQHTIPEAKKYLAEQGIEMRL
ncbi:imidazole glycerol phosphate synthase, cyclase subunit HisF [Mycobacteroides abscessus subsp. abscessus]|nr:imidazole glycerol phosphate synthase, cyclase subunit HisF [Mycobacteroides abscessus subsp. abscessus]